MKGKVSSYLFIAVALMISLVSCEKGFIEVQPKGQFLSANYYSNKDQAFAGLVGVYDVMRKNSGGFENMITMMNAGSDDQVAGGGGSTDGACLLYTSDAADEEDSVDLGGRRIIKKKKKKK